MVAPRQKILFVEDEEALQVSLTSALKEAGYKPVSAYDGETAIALAEREHPDLILLDIILPRRSGFEVLEELKSNESTRDIPVIVLTNLERISDVERMLSLGATNYLVKANYEISDILTKVRQILDRPKL